MGDELRRRLRQHSRTGPIAADTVVTQTPDPAVAGDLGELKLFDLFAKVRALLGPLRAFDHPAIHIRDVNRAIGTGGDIRGTKQRIERANELRWRIAVLQLWQPFGLHRPKASTESSQL